MPRKVDDADYEVGFAKPPLATRFKKGRSGNPAGRPKKRSIASDDFRAMLNEKSPVRIGGKLQRMTTLPIVLKQLRAKAVNGDLAAARFVIQLAERIESKTGKGNTLWDGDIEFTLDIGDKKVIGPGEPLIEPGGHLNENEQEEEEEDQ